MVRIALVDDHVMFRQTLRHWLHFVQGFSVVAEAGGSSEFAEVYKPEEVDIILLDLRLKGESGLVMCKNLFASNPNVKIIILSGYDEDVYILESIKSGACGYICKTSSIAAVEKTIKEVVANGFYYDQDIGQLLRDDMLKPHKRKLTGENFSAEFNKIELDIVTSFANQLSSKDIATKLNLSVRSIESYKRAMIEKTYSINFIGVLVYCIQNRLILPEQLETEVALNYKV